MDVKPHGWVQTRTGSMVHYFGLQYNGGSPLALCHNALRMDSGAEFQPEPNGYEACDSCSRYLAKQQKQERTRAAQAQGRFAVGVTVEVVRGKLAGTSGAITEASKDFTGFWWVKLAADKPAMLSEGQLQVKK